jgi:predicted nuclease of predicted toxin-antitoxin system
MSLAILVDMNLSPDWVPVLTGQGWRTVHWSSVGDPRAADQVIMAWALANAHIVFTHDLDFGTALALAHLAGPSVLQIRGQDVLPSRIGSLVIAALRQHEADLAAGALVVVDERRCRVRVLPLFVADEE